jgi:hypothetical protein
VGDYLPAVIRNESEFKEAADQRIVLPEGCSKADTVFLLSRNIPSNEFGLPEWFLRSDLLPDPTQLNQADVNNAAEGLFYYDGYPVTQYGSSFWQQLPHEPYEQFGLFGKYLDQAIDIGIRQLDILALAAGKDLEQVQQYYREFYWSTRARAYDIFVVAAERKRREHLTRKMENTHFNKAGEMLAVLEKRFEDPAWIDELNAKEAIEAVETLMKLQRLSLGLTGQHASSNEGMPRAPGMSAEFVMRQITQGAGMLEGAGSNISGRIEELLRDPESGMRLQEMILRVNTESHQQVD